MNLESILPYAFGGLFAATMAYMLFRVVRHRGFKGAMFGARVERTVGEVNGVDAGPVSSVVKVHALDRGDPERAVGIEFVSRSIGSYSMVPVTLSQAEARKLVSLLQSAIA